MKDIWKLLMIAMMAIAMVGCPQGGSNDTSDEEEEAVEPAWENPTNWGEGDIYFSGFNGNCWASDQTWTGSGGNKDAIKGTRSGNVVTWDLTTDVDPLPYGFKMTTEKGWEQQYIPAGVKTATDKLVITPNEWTDVITATKTQLEWKENGAAKYPDNNTKWFTPSFASGAKTIHVEFNLETMKVKVSSEQFVLMDPAVISLDDDFLAQEGAGIILKGGNRLKGSDIFAAFGTDKKAVAKITVVDTNAWNADKPADPLAIYGGLQAGLNNELATTYEQASFGEEKIGESTVKITLPGKDYANLIITDLTGTGNYIVTVDWNDGEPTVTVTVDEGGEDDSSVADEDSSVADEDSSVADEDSSVADEDSSEADEDSSEADEDSSVADEDSSEADEDSSEADEDSSVADEDSSVADEDSSVADEDSSEA